MCGLIGASLSEPHTSESNGRFLYIIIYLSYVVPFNPKHCAHRSVQAKQLRKGSTLELEPFHLNVDTHNNSRKAPKSAQEQEDRARRAAETADQRSERLRKLRVRDRARRATQTASERQASTLQRLLYSGKVHERRETKPPRREKRSYSG